MRITKVDARAFGPFTGTRAMTLEFAPGLTLVFGPNESGKSSLHAATYTAVSGRKRGRGSATLAERAFRRKHEPWGGGGWAVGCVLELAGGRRVELTHDLSGKVNCRAVDAATGIDVSGAIMHEGSPDGSRYLGLNRSIFGAVAVVNQAELLKVIDAANGLQQELQRAATSATGERPAAGALAAIEDFRADQVGSDRAWKKPLAVAREAERAAMERLKKARLDHEEYLRLVADAEAAEGAARDAVSAARDAQAALERAQALGEEVRELSRLRADLLRVQELVRATEERLGGLQGDAQRAEALNARFDGVEPQGLADGEQLAQQVGAALDHWLHAPGVPILSGPSSADIQREIDELPGQPDGDLEVHPEVNHAAATLAAARRAAQQRVPVPDPQALDDAAEAAGRVGPSTLRELATRIDAATDLGAARSEDAQARLHLGQASDVRRTAALEHDERHAALRGAEESVREAERALAEARLGAATAASGPNIPMLGFGVAMALVGAWLIGTRAAVGSGLLVAGAALAVMALRRRLRPAPPDTDGPVGRAEQALRTAQEHHRAAVRGLEGAQRLLQEAQRAVAAAEARAEASGGRLAQAERTWQALTNECQLHAVPQDAAALRALAARIDEWQRHAGDHQRHLLALERERADIQTAEKELLGALDARGAPEQGTLDDRLAAYRRDCRARADQARQADRRAGLLRSLEQVRALEAAVRQAVHARGEALEALTRAAAAIGVDCADDSQPQEAGRLIEALDAWSRERAADLARLQEDQRDWATLQELLAGGTLGDMRAAVGRVREELGSQRESLESAQESVRHCVQSVSDRARDTGLDPATVTGPEGLTAVSDAASRARDELSRMAEQADKLRVEAASADERLRLRADALDPVADAETDAAAAAAELARITRLDAVLAHTLRHLTHAQEQVHRDIAPVLADSIADRIGTVTLGRYTRVRIDPKSLQVQVAPAVGDFVAADSLSFGTTEQIYLLVRIALAEMLGNGDEPCPLLLDDVTVHADGPRTTKILEALLALAGERQVILFSQEQEVLDWAEGSLAGADRHKVITLDPVPTTH